MNSCTFTESEVEEAALAWFAGLGYEILSGPEIAPGRLHSAPITASPPFPGFFLVPGHRSPW